MASSERIFYLVCGILLFVGGIVFIWGGSQHPPTDARLGTVGSEEFFRNFVRHIVEHGNWQSIHTGILAGPLCWALGGVGASLMLRQRGEIHFSVLGAVALAMGATAWAVTFVFDGFVALVTPDGKPPKPFGLEFRFPVAALKADPQFACDVAALWAGQFVTLKGTCQGSVPEGEYVGIIFNDAQIVK